MKHYFSCENKQSKTRYHYIGDIHFIILYVQFFLYILCFILSLIKAKLLILGAYYFYLIKNIFAIIIHNFSDVNYPYIILT